MSTSTINQARGKTTPISSGGSFKGVNNTLPDAILSDAATEASQLDQRANIERAGHVFADATTIPTAKELFRDDCRVIITLGDDGYVAEAEFNNVDVVQFVCDMKGLDRNKDAADATQWLDVNRESFDGFLEHRGITSDGHEWDNERLFVAEYLRDQDAVNFAEAGSTLRMSERANYLADGLSENGDVDFGGDLFEFITKARKAA